MRAERQLGFLWGFVSLGSLALAPLADRLAAFAPACPIRSWAGLPCPSCGATRALTELARFDFAEALAWNPLVTIFVVVAVAGGLVAGLAAAVGRGVPESPRELPRSLRWAVLLLVAANWFYLVRHGV